MSKKEMTLVYYHVPEDKDDPDCPNVFGVSQSKNNLRLIHIYESFPLKGTYIFRFKYTTDGQTVWLDLPDSESKLPTFKDKIYVKATRVSWNDSKLNSHYRPKHQPSNTENKTLKPDQIDFFENKPVSKIQDKKVPQVYPKTDHIDILNQKSFSPSQAINGINLLGSPSNSINSSTASSQGIDFFAAVNTDKKNDSAHLIGMDFSKNGDLI